MKDHYEDYTLATIEQQWNQRKSMKQMRMATIFTVPIIFFWKWGGGAMEQEYQIMEYLLQKVSKVCITNYSAAHFSFV